MFDRYKLGSEYTKQNVIQSSCIVNPRVKAFLVNGEIVRHTRAADVIRFPKFFFYSVQ